MSKEAVARPVVPFYNPPTYHALCGIIVAAVDSIFRGRFPHEKTTAFDKLRDQLFLSPRLVQWNSGVDEKGIRTFSLLTQDETTVVHVTDKSVWLEDEDDLPPVRHTVVEGLSAATLFNSIVEAQALIRIEPIDMDDEAFFEAADPDFIPSAGLDAALEESETKPMTEDDAELIDEVTKDSRPGQIAVEDVEFKVEGAKEELEDVDPQAKQYVGKINKSASSEAYQVKEEYKDVEPVKDCPRMENTRVVARLKSLQGRMLNIVEAALSGGQLTAVKTLINKEFRREMNLTSNSHSDEE